MAETFGCYIAAQCSDRFDSYSVQKLEVTEEQPAPPGVICQRVKANGGPVEVDYVLRQNGQSWLISDLHLDGAISEEVTQRSEFFAVLKRDGIDGLIAALDRKVELLTATVAKSF